MTAVVSEVSLVHWVFPEGIKPYRKENGLLSSQLSYEWGTLPRNGAGFTMSSGIFKSAPNQ